MQGDKLIKVLERQTESVTVCERAQRLYAHFSSKR